jgi:hypothetical protein
MRKKKAKVKNAKVKKAKNKAKKVKAISLKSAKKAKKKGVKKAKKKQAAKGARKKPLALEEVESLDSDYTDNFDTMDDDLTAVSCKSSSIKNILGA